MDVVYNGTPVTYGTQPVTYGAEAASGTFFLDAFGLSDTGFLGPVAPQPSRTGGGYLLGDYRYRIYVRDGVLTRLGEVDDFNSASYALRFNAVGGWLLSVPADGIAAELLARDGAGIEIVRDGEPLLSGPVRERHLTWDLASPGGTLEASGPDDLCWIAGRLAPPDATGPPYDSVIFDTRTGLAETLILGYVNDNAGRGAVLERQVNGLVMDIDHGLGTSVFGRARFDNLLTLITALALVGGDIGFRVYELAGQLVFSVYQPVDRTASVEFSIRRENVTTIDHALTALEANYIIAGGDGAGTSRTFRQRGDTASIARWGRVESFLDQRGTTATSELQDDISGALAEQAAQESISVTATDTEAIAFGRDYNLGDKVAAIAADRRITDLIREIDVDLSGDGGEVISVTVGTPAAAPPDDIAALLLKDVKPLKRRMNRLESRDPN